MSTFTRCFTSHTSRGWHAVALACFALGFTGCMAMEIRWTRMVGQWPVEASPVTKDGDILILNRGGQLLLLSADGERRGSGQDGTVSQLPEGRWTTSPMILETTSGKRIIVVSVEGRVVALDGSFQKVWEYRLPGETPWGRAIPCILKSDTDPVLVFSDASGTVTCLRTDGTLNWTNALGSGACKAPANALVTEGPGAFLAVPAGSKVFCLDSSGKTRWQRDLRAEVVTRPEFLSLAGRQLIVAGAASGALYALNLDGSVAWECATDDTFSNWLVPVVQSQQEPLIIFTGLWGNLHAVSAHGNPVWTRFFRSKTRARPALIDADMDGHPEIFVPTFHQHLYQFDLGGNLRDDIRLSGTLPSSPVLIDNPLLGIPDLLVSSTTLLAYRLHPGVPRSQYGTTAEPRSVRIEPAAKEGTVCVANPKGALLNVQVVLSHQNDACKRILGLLTAQSAFEIPWPELVRTGAWSVAASIRDVRGNLLDEKSWNIPWVRQESRAPEGIRAWPTAAYGSFDEKQIQPPATEQPTAASIDNLYLDEVDEAACIVAAGINEAIRVRISLPRPVRADGTAFGGMIVLRQVVPTGSVNGEQVPDALPALGDSGLITIPSERAAKVWFSVDAHGAQPGTYTGHVAIMPLVANAKTTELPFKVAVVSLRLPRPAPLTLCSWDYVPNRWYPAPATKTLDDMTRHGVNVFPRSTIPSGKADATGKVTIDWGVLEAELQRLQNRGRILFHINHPPLEFFSKPTDEQKHRAEIEYIRLFRDHLRERGWNYPDYAIYLLDEPGLDYGPNVAILVETGKLFREADPKIQTYTDPVPGLSWKDLERIEPLVDVWAPNMRLVSGLLSGDPRIQRIMRAKTVWSYECVSQVKSLSSLRYNRANAWRAKFFGLSGIGFWTHSTGEADIWLPGKSINDEYALVYPGDNAVPSVRWEAVRDGLEDVAAIALLETEMKNCRAGGRHPELVIEAEETIRIALRDILEFSDEAFVESRDFLRQGDRVLGHTRTNVESFNRHRAEIARLTFALAAE
jgi:hypothetical protein